MSENSEKGANQQKPANPAKVVRPASRGDAAASTESAGSPATAKTPVTPAPAKASGAGAPAAAKKAAPAPKATPAKKTAPAASQAPAPAPVAQEEPKRGFGDRLRSGVAKTASLAQVRNSGAAAEAAPDATGTTEDARQARRARLLLTRIDPWSVARVAFLLSAAFGVVLFVAVLITWSVLGAAGIWDAVNSVVGTVAASSDGVSTFDIRDYVGMGRVLGLTLVVSVVNVVLLTAMATLMAYLYNMAAALLGGVEVTFSEEQA